MNEWISVYDRLPRMEETVIVTDGIHIWMVGRYLGLTDKDPTLWLWHKRSVMNVKYWMPKEGALPPIPEEEKK